jgi:hypothetical protein
VIVELAPFGHLNFAEDAIAARHRAHALGDQGVVLLRGRMQRYRDLRGKLLANLVTLLASFHRIAPRKRMTVQMRLTARVDAVISHHKARCALTIVPRFA